MGTSTDSRNTDTAYRPPANAISASTSPVNTPIANRPPATQQTVSKGDPFFQQPVNRQPSIQPTSSKGGMR